MKQTRQTTPLVWKTLSPKKGRMDGQSWKDREWRMEASLSVEIEKWGEYTEYE